MKQTHDLLYEQKEQIDKLIDLLSSKNLLEEKMRVNLYMPKAVLKLLDSLSQDTSRGEFVSSLVIKEASKKKKLPFGMFSGVEISEEEIEQITSELDKVVNELT